MYEEFLLNWKTIGKLTNRTRRTRKSEMLPNVKSAFHICFASHLPSQISHNTNSDTMGFWSKRLPWKVQNGYVSMFLEAVNLFHPECFT